MLNVIKDLAAHLFGLPAIAAAHAYFGLLQRWVWGVQRSGILYERIAYAYHRSNLALLRFFWGLQVDLNGAPPAAGGRPVILVANHQSWLDITLLSASCGPQQPRFVARPGLDRGVPVVSYSLREFGHVVLSRGDQEENFRKLVALGLRAGASDGVVAIFPEGCITRGRMRSFKRTGLRLLLQAMPRALVAPVAIDGSYRLLNDRILPIPRGVRIRLRYLEAFENNGEPDALIERCHRAIEESLGQPSAAPAYPRAAEPAASGPPPRVRPTGHPAVEALALRGARLASRRPGWCLGACVLGLALLTGLGAPRARVDPSIRSFLLAEDPLRDRFDEDIRRFGGDEILLLAFRSPDLFSPGTVGKVAALVERLEAQPGVEQVKSIYTAKHIAGDEEGLRIGPLLPGPKATEEERARMLETARADPLFRDNLVSRDGRTGAVVVFLGVGATESDKLRLVKRVEKEVAGLQGPEEFYYSGTPVVKVEASEMVRRDYARVVPAALVLCSAVIAVIEGTAIGFVAAFLVGLWTLIGALMAWFALGGDLNSYSATAPLILLVISIAYAAHMVARYRQTWLRAAGAGLHGRSAARAAGRAAFSEMARPLGYICLTTVLGFASLAASPIPCIRQLGLILALGVPLAYVNCLFAAVPLLVLGRAFSSLRPELGAKERRGPFRSIATLSYDNFFAVCLATACLIAVSVLLVRLIRIETNTFAWLPDEARVVRSEDFIKRNLLSTSTMNLFVKGKTPGRATDPDFLRKAQRLQAALERDEKVDGIISLVDYVRQLHQAAQGGRPEGRVIPDSGALIDQYLFVLGDPRSIDRLTDPDRESLRFFIRVKDRDSRSLQQIRERVLARAREEFKGEQVAIEAGSTLFFIGRSFDHLASFMLESLGLALAMMFLFLAWMLGSPVLAAYVMIPNAIPILCTYGLLGLMGYRLDAAISTVACGLLGIAVDDSIHFVHAFEQNVRGGAGWRKVVGRTFISTGRAMTLTTVVLVAGLFVFSMAVSKWMGVFGSVLISGIVLCLVMDLFLLPGLMLLYHESRATEFSWDWLYDAARPTEKMCLVTLAKTVRFRKGEELVPGVDGHCYFIQSGRARMADFEGKRPGLDAGPRDMLGEFDPAVGPVPLYKVEVIEDLEAVSVPAGFLGALANGNPHVRRILLSAFRRRAAWFREADLLHNSLLLHPVRRLLSAASWLAARKLVPYLRPWFDLRVTWCVSSSRPTSPGNVVYVGNAASERGKVAAALALSRASEGGPSGAPHLLTSEEAWRGGLRRTLASLWRILLVDRSAPVRARAQLNILKQVLRAYEEQVLLLFPWRGQESLEADEVGQWGLQWIVENLECRIVPFWMSEASESPGKALTVRCHFGEPLDAAELRRAGGLAESERAIVQRVLAVRGEAERAAQDLGELPEPAPGGLPS